MSKRKLPQWCKNAKAAMINQDIDQKDLIEGISEGRERLYARAHVSAVLNGSVYSRPLVKKISDYLNISDVYDD